MKYLHTMVRVTNLEQSLAFYRDALGLELLRVREVPAGRFTLAFLAAPGDADAQVASGPPTEVGSEEHEELIGGEGRTWADTLRRVNGDSRDTLKPNFDIFSM